MADTHRCKHVFVVAKVMEEDGVEDRSWVAGGVSARGVAKDMRAHLVRGGGWLCVTQG